ncbi:MAG: hypothetical protein HC929_14585 [Leptolyngbyaceae cyanobacterium SM2_5_2]|nr:hypothetical protein [Leptolyngbyaceae cyanobacterium SM2_5_2]
MGWCNSHSWLIPWLSSLPLATLAWGWSVALAVDSTQLRQLLISVPALPAT